MLEVADSCNDVFIGRVAEFLNLLRYVAAIQLFVFLRNSGFKKATGCSHAIYTARSVISNYVVGYVYS